MPRQLPWVSKAQPRPARNQGVAASLLDDDFFDGTMLAHGGSGKERALDSEDDLHDLAADSSTPQTNLLGRGAHRVSPALSSSPPPIAKSEEVQAEPMRQAVSQFHLRDDEWMMVEDEFLETAKLFTRHLHIAEYERLKRTIEARKKEAGIARPAVPSADFSPDSSMRKTAKRQEKHSRPAVRPIFTGQTHNNEPPTTQAKRTKTPSLPAIPSDPDSDDLDTFPPPRRHTHPHPKKPTPAPAPPPRSPTPPRPPLDPRRRPPRTTTPLDILDAYAPPRSAHTPAPRNAENLSATRYACPTPSPPLQAHATTEEDTPAATATAGAGTSARLAKRKAEPDGRGTTAQRRSRTKRHAVQLDDIPTFLF